MSCTEVGSDGRVHHTMVICYTNLVHRCWLPQSNCTMLAKETLPTSHAWGLAASVDMLERRQLSSFHFVDHTLHSSIRRCVRFRSRDSISSANVLEQLLGAILVAYDGEDFVFAA